MADGMERGTKLVRLLIITGFVCFSAMIYGQAMTRPTEKIDRLARDFPVSDLSNSAWKRGSAIKVATYWNGTKAPSGRRFEIRMLWSESALYVRFDATQTEPLVVSDKPELARKTMQLWERDVCELFLAPDTRNRRRYFEFEVAPTGEWLDLMVDWTKDEPRNWEYTSGMETFAKIEPERVTMVMKIPWIAFGKKPEAGDVWLGNLFRCVGSDPDRGYLAWSPTMTKTPQFHKPEQFGEFVFQE